ncbi:hypothetical protein PSTT_15693, partial [Puccinia striiformis]
LVIDGFESIRRKYGSSRLPPDQAYIQGPPYTLPIGRIKVESNVILLKELLSDLLPLLARQLGTLSLLLNPEEIRKDPGSNLMRLLELQPALHLNMTRVTNSIALISPRLYKTVDRVDDQELKRFKSYWLNELADDLIEIRFHVSCICYATCTDIEGLDLCMVYEFLEETGDTDPSVCKDFIEEAIDYINTAIKTVEGAYGMTRHLGRAIGSLGKKCLDPIHPLPVRLVNQRRILNYGFVNKDRWPRSSVYFQEVTPALSTEKVESNEVLLNELLSQLLPLLAGQLNTLSLSLNPEDIRRDPGSKLSRLLELQLAIDNSMTRVAYYMALICPRPLHTLDRVDDNKLERFKSHWLNKLVESIEHMQFQVAVALNAACEHIEALNLCIVHESMEDTASDFTDSLAPSFYEDLIHKALIVINSTIKLRSESELIFASRSWEQGVHGMTQKLREAIGSLGAEVTRWNTLDTRMFSGAAGTLASRFEAPKLLFLVHVIPLIQEIDLDYYENWFATWNTQFGLAINNFQYYARSFDHIPG